MVGRVLAPYGDGDQRQRERQRDEGSRGKKLHRKTATDIGNWARESICKKPDPHSPVAKATCEWDRASMLGGASHRRPSDQKPNLIRNPP